MTTAALALPDYREQSAEVRARFAALAERPAVLSVRNLCKRFASTRGEIVALDDIAFDVREGEFISVIGRSGCGKSTLIRAIAGLEQPSEGDVCVDGQPVSGPGADRGMVFQQYTLFPWLSVRDNVAFGPRMSGTPKRTARRDARAWLDLVGLSGFGDHYPAQLSGGMKQRVAIARALASRPRVLLMDEPFGALDAQTRASMQRHLLRIWDDTELTVLFITHDLEEAVYLADRIVVLDAHPGRVREVIEVPVPRPRSRDDFLSPPFLATKRRLELLIHPDTQDDDEADTTT